MISADGTVASVAVRAMVTPRVKMAAAVVRGSVFEHVRVPEPTTSLVENYSLELLLHGL